MTIQAALAKLRRRNINFTTLRVALHHNNLPTSNGWAKLEQKYADLQIPAMETASYINKLEKIYRDNIDWGNKAIQFAIFDENVDVLLTKSVEHRFTPELSPRTPFPTYVTDDELGELTLQPALVTSAVNSTRTGVTLYFYSRAYETERETFSVNEMQDEASALRFAGYDHVVAYRQLIYQRIDTVFIDAKNRRIEFRVDGTRLKTTDRMVEVLMELKACFRTLMQTQVDVRWGQISFPLANFFTKIEDMYNDKTGGLVELGHNTAAGAINHGRMRGHQGDMRDDPSHIASMSASVTEKFAIQKAYKYYNDSSTIHLRIPGKSADTGSVTPMVNTAVVEDCIDGQQFEDLMRILR